MAVLNKHKDKIPPGAIYIGRGSKWGNPFVIGQHGTRTEVCDKYENRLQRQLDAGIITHEELAELHGKDLVCFCAPLRCHGHTLEGYAQDATVVLAQRKHREEQAND